MTIGIYALKFNGTDKVYIGQSSNVDRRFLEHLAKIRNNSANYKIMDAYTKYGLPELVILVECSTLELNILEKQFIDEFDSIINGLNITDGGHSGSGPNHSISIYTKEELLLALKLLGDNRTLSLDDIEILSKVSKRTLQAIIWNQQHSWLKESYPTEYSAMLFQNNKRIDLGIKNASISRNSKAKGKNYKIISPTNQEHDVDSINEFARQNKLDPSALCRVLKGKSLSHKGWRLAKGESSGN